MVSEIKNNSSILDIGCGDGGFLFYLKGKREKIKETAIDKRTIGVNRAVNKGINAIVRSLDFYNDEKVLFDIVVLSKVIEHVDDSEYYVSRGFDLAKEKLIISIPNSGYYSFRLRLLLGRFPVQ
jgi:methionine biosynthesis protein MetW